MPNITLHTLNELKQKREKFAVLTAYDAIFSETLSLCGIELLLVGDSLGMVLQGHDSTLPVTLEQMVYHTQCVAKGNKGSLIMADLPFMSYATENQALESSATLMRAGAHLVKLEGGSWLLNSIKSLKERGIPTCVHLGLTPQSIHKFGGFRVQGKTDIQAKTLIEDSIKAEKMGADLLLLECIPRQVTQKIMLSVNIPVIGIGAGPECDAQVLVLHDLLGLGSGKRPRFIKNFLNGSVSGNDGASGIEEAIKRYIEAVKSGTFPSNEHCF